MLAEYNRKSLVIVNMYGRLALALASAFALNGLVNAAVPRDPTITAAAVLPKRQNSDQFIGYLELNNTWYTDTCNAGLTWYQDGKYAQCCPATLKSCYAPTACVSGSLVFPYSDLSTTRTIACTENYGGDTRFSICNTAFIFESFGDSSPKTDIVCGSSSLNWSYYRKVPASVTQAVNSIPTSIPQAVSTAPISPGQQSNSGTKRRGGSKAWIAGAVVGPILGLALVAAIVFFCMRKKKKNKPASQQGGAAMAGINPSHPPAGVGGYTDAKPQFAAQQQTYNPDPYAGQQTAYNAQQQQPYNVQQQQPYNVQQQQQPYNAQPQQQGYPQAPLSPAPQYNTAGSPVPAPASQEEHYNSDVTHGYTATAPNNNVAAEIGGGQMSSPAGASTQASPVIQHVPHLVPHAQAAELSGPGTTTSAGNGAGLFSSELPGSQAAPRQ